MIHFARHLSKLLTHAKHTSVYIYMYIYTHACIHNTFIHTCFFTVKAHNDCGTAAFIISGLKVRKLQCGEVLLPARRRGGKWWSLWEPVGLGACIRSRPAHALPALRYVAVWGADTNTDGNTEHTNISAPTGTGVSSQPPFLRVTWDSPGEGIPTEGNSQKKYKRRQGWGRWHI